MRGHQLLVVYGMLRLALALPPRQLASSAARRIAWAQHRAFKPSPLLATPGGAEEALDACQAPSYRGVRPAANGQWRVALTAGGKVHRLGPFATAEEAARAYDSAARELQGARSKLNFPDDVVGTSTPTSAITDSLRSRSSSTSSSAGNNLSGSSSFMGSNTQINGDDSSITSGTTSSTASSSSSSSSIESVSDGEPEDAYFAELRKSLGNMWVDRLAALQRPAACALVPLLSPLNELGYTSLTSDAHTGRAKQGTLLAYVMDQKAAHPGKVCLVRVGDFYEAFGADAIMLVEHAGLNPMGGKPRAGCPWRNLQGTLDGLVGDGGLTVAVFEEVAEPDKKKGIKSRFLAQVVSPGSPTYLYDVCLRADDVDVRASRPYAAVGKTSSGYTLALAQVDSRVYSVLDRLTPEALRATLAVEAPVEPVYLAPGTANKDMPWSTQDLATAPLPSPAAAAFRNHRHTTTTIDPYSATDAVASSVTASSTSTVGSNLNWSGNPGADALGAGLLSALSHELLLEPSGFRCLDRHAALSLAASAAKSSRSSSSDSSSSSSGSGSNSVNNISEQEGEAEQGRRPSPLAQVARPLHLSTAQQVGLLDGEDGRVPSLASQLLPSGGASNKASERLLRRWLLQPPPAAIADARATVLHLLDPKSRSTGSGNGAFFSSSSSHLDQDENESKASAEASSGVASAPLPPFRSSGGVPLGKLVSMLAVAQGNPSLFRDLALMLHAVLTLLGAPPLPEALHVWTPAAADAAAAAVVAAHRQGAEDGEGDGMHNNSNSDAVVKLMAADWLNQATASATDGTCHAGRLEPLVDPMLLITAHESGLPVRREVFLRGAAQLLADLATTVAPPSPINSARPSSSSSLASAANGNAGEEDGDDESIDAGEGSSTMASSGNGAMKIDGVSFHNSVPIDFFAKNEETWRGCVRATNSSSSSSKSRNDSGVAAAYEAVSKASHVLGDTVRADFPSGTEVYFDALNNQLLLRKIPASSATSGHDGGSGDNDEETPLFYNPRDRTGKVMAGRWTTARVAEAQAEYLACCARAESAVRAAVAALSKRLANEMPTLCHAAHWSAALHALTLHSQEASRKGWCLPNLVEFPCPAVAPPGGIGAYSSLTAATSMSHQPHGAAAEELQEWIIADDEEGSESAKESAAVPPRPPPLLIAEGLVPYWLNLPQKKINSKSDNASNRGNSGGSGSGVGNDVSLSAGELVLLTAPNMSGKSTLMRSLLSASLLANCGLRVPAHHFQAPRFDAFFLRAAGGDSPAEGKSAWALEADETRAMCRDASSHSLVMVDELGRGTSSRDGAALAGALLEALDAAGAGGIFSTHLHELLDLPLQLSPRVSRRRMGVNWVPSSHDVTSSSGSYRDSIDSNIDSSEIESSSSSSTDNGMVFEPEWTYQLEHGTCRDSLALHTGRRCGLGNAVVARAAQLSASFDVLCRPNASAFAALVDGDSSRSALRNNALERVTPLTSSPSVAAAAAGAEAMAVASETSGLEIASDILRDLMSTNSNSDINPNAAAAVLVKLPPRWSPPSSMAAGTSVVYVLELPPVSTLAGPENAYQQPGQPVYYVGETDAFAARLQQHRNKKAGGQQQQQQQWRWADVACVAVAVSDKSTARALEADLIRALVHSGVPLLSENDGKHRNFGAGSSFAR